ncbi:cytoskeleton protein RodZ [Aliidiomarina indica]|uniref:cytoskeleton protein RodZ n=1 Tax=Aliidiomarina indica TaxID=2749147 RepID=UPI0018904F79|nr:cytoskeleton protein RodZ [Aliidiomarina indica]
MTETNKNDELPFDEVSENETSAPVSPGELLRQAREQAGLSVSQIADRLRLRRTQIEELEANEFSKYVGGTYIRGYLRSYAKLVSLDEATVISSYQTFIGEEAPPGQMQSFSQKTKLESQDNKLMLITWIIILILIGSVAVFVWQQFTEEQNGNGVVTQTSTQQRTTSRPEVTPERSETVQSQTRLDSREEDDVIAPDETEDLVEAPVEPPEVTGTREPQVGTETRVDPPRTDVSTDPATTPRTESMTPVTTAEAPVQSTTTEEAIEAVAEAELVLTFSDDCWVRIEDATGTVIAFGVKQRGHVMPLEGEAPYEITLGAPQAVTVYFRGEQIDLSRFRGRTARFTLPTQS